MTKTAYLYVLDTLSDWEPGYIASELNSGQYFKEKGQKISVKTVGPNKDPIVTKGGMTVVPDTTPEEITPDNTSVLLLVGADLWHETKHIPIIEKTKELLDAGTNVAAICGATGVLANAGLFDNRTHTSNSIQYPDIFKDFYKDLPYFKGYKGQAHFKDAVAVADDNLITASSAGSLLWAKLILARLGVFSDEALEAWYNYFNTGDAKYFFELMEKVPAQ